MQFFSPRQAAKVLGVGQATAHRFCVRHTGFAQWLDGHWRIPQAHIDRVLAGETPAQIRRHPSLPADNAATGSAARLDDAALQAARTAAARAYLFTAAAASCQNDRPVEVREQLLTTATNDILDALQALGLSDPDALREALLACNGIEEIRQAADINLHF